MISLKCGNLKKSDTSELIYKIETDSQTQTTNLWLPNGKDKRGVNWEHGINRYTLRQRTLVGYSPQGCKELDMTEATQHTHMYETEKKQEPTIQHRELYSVPCDNP